MLDEKKVTELNDEELEQISGGVVLLPGCCGKVYVCGAFQKCPDYDSSKETCQSCPYRPISV